MNVAMEITCTQCGAKASLGDPEERRGAWVCSACREVHPLRALARASCAKPWTGVRISSAPGVLELRARWARWNSLVPLAFGVVWLGFVTSWYVFIGPLMLSFASWRSAFNLFPLLCTVAILAFTYYVFARLANVTMARLDAREFVVSQRPMPLHRSVRVPRHAVERASVRQRSSQPPEGRHVETPGARYDVEVVFGDGRRVIVAPDLTELERALNVRHLIECTLEETSA